MDTTNVNVRNLLKREEDAKKRWIKAEEEIVKLMEEEANQAEQRLHKLMEFRESRWSTNLQKSSKLSTVKKSKVSHNATQLLKTRIVDESESNRSSQLPEESVSETDDNVESTTELRQASKEEENQESSDQEERRQPETSKQRQIFPMVKIEKIDWSEHEGTPSPINISSKDTLSCSNKKKETSKQVDSIVLCDDKTDAPSTPCSRRTNQGKSRIVLPKRALNGQFLPNERCAKRGSHKEERRESHDALQESCCTSKMPRHSVSPEGECRGLGS